MTRPPTASETTFRRVTAADLPRLFPVFREALNGYLVPTGQPPVPDEDDQLPMYAHLLAHDAERLWLAERADGSGARVVAWGSGLVRGDWWFLSCLFVVPEAQGAGVGARLFELAQTGAPPGAVRATVTDSVQPISNTLYARRGLLPREVLVGFAGALPGGLERPRLGRLVPEPLTAASIPDLATVDDAAAGLDRGVDHEFYLGASGRRGWLFRRAGRPAAYVMVRADGWVGPAASVSAGDMEAVVRYALADLAATGVPRARAGVTGRCEGAQRAFWDAGLVYESSAGLLLASRPFGRLDRYVAASYGMF